MNRRSRLTLVGVSSAAAAMLILSFAAEPLYSTFCRVTGFGGTTQVAVKAPDRVLDRTVRVRFDANVDPAAPLAFTAVEPFIEAKLGETVLSFYEVTNTSDGPVAAMASYNVAPHKAGVYFNKIECFCFKKKIFQPGASERLPVIFYVSPDMDKDRLADDVRSITLSYTYFLADDVPQTARLEDASAVY
jgi:cytochrome c oxidase assembly protein subunit 11